MKEKISQNEEIIRETIVGLGQVLPTMCYDEIAKALSTDEERVTKQMVRNLLKGRTAKGRYFREIQLAIIAYAENYLEEQEKLLNQMKKVNELRRSIHDSLEEWTAQIQ